MTQPHVQAPDDAVQRLGEALQSGTMQDVRRMLRALHPAEAAQLLESLPRAQRFIVWDMLGHDRDGEVLLEVGEEVRASLIEETDAGNLVAATRGLETDDLTDLLADLPATVRSAVLSGMEDRARSRVESMLSFDEDTAGGLMDTNVITVRADVTLEIVFRYLRQFATLPSQTNKLMVVDRFETYLGELPLATLLVSDPATLVADVMDTDAQAIPIDMPEHDVAAIFEDRDLVSAPVVDAHGLLIGRITIDDVVDVIRDEGTETLHKSVGLGEGEDLFGAVVPAARRRGVWLGINLITAFLAAATIGLFEETIEKIVALAVLMPVVASMGGVAGSQTLVLVIRGLALGQISDYNVRALLVKEFSVSVLNSLLWCALTAAIAGLWFDDWMIGVVIALALIANLVFAAMAGVLLPLTLQKLHIDPALASNVVLTTITDIVGFFVFLGLGTALLL